MALKVTRWWWIRHAPVLGMDGILYGSDDVPCDTSDTEVFKKLAANLPEDAFWITSHLSRTRHTADTIRSMGLNCMTPITEAQIGEQNFGEWQGLKWSEMEKRDPVTYRNFWKDPVKGRPPNGESFNDQIIRVSSLIDKYNTDKAGQTIVAVSHAGAIRAAIVHALSVSPAIGMSFSIDNLSLTCLEYVEGGLLRGRGGDCRVVCVNRVMDK